MTQQDESRKAIEYALTRWAQDRRSVDEARDGLVCDAHAAGISKHRVHVLTGIARTTIDSILREADPPG